LLVSVSITFLYKTAKDLFSRPFMNFTNNHYEELKIRYIQELRYSRNKFFKESCNTEAAAEAYGLSFLLRNNLPMDELNTNRLWKNYHTKDPIFVNSNQD